MNPVPAMAMTVLFLAAGSSIGSAQDTTPANRFIGLLQPVQVSGHIVSERGGPVADLPRVLVAAQPGMSVGSQRGGSFSLSLLPGVHQLKLIGLPSGITVKSMSYDGRELVSNSLMVSNPMTEEIRIIVDASAYEAKSGVSVSGALANVPPEFAGKEYWVKLVSHSGMLPVETWVEKDGSFELAKILPGAYEAYPLWATQSDQPARSLPISEIVVGTEAIRGLTLDLQNKPFPEYPEGSYARVFDSQKLVTLEGVITQAIAPLRPRVPVYSFRMNVRDEATGAMRQWAIMLSDSKGMPAGDPDLAKLPVGTRVSIVVNTDRDGSPRGFVIPQGDPGSIAGFVVRTP